MTKQSTDSIVIDGQELPLYSQPLSKYLLACAPKFKFQSGPSFNWRGYVADWIIRDGSLFLNNVFGDLESGKSVTVASLFPFADGPVLALWCNDTLQIPYEQRSGSSGRGYVYSTEYQREMLISIEAGKVTNLIKQEVHMN